MSTIYILVATLIATVEIIPARDADGKEIFPDPDPEYTPGLVRSDFLPRLCILWLISIFTAVQCHLRASLGRDRSIQ